MGYKLRRTIGKQDFSKPDIPLVKHDIIASAASQSEFVRSTERAAAAMLQFANFDYSELEARVMAVLAAENRIVRPVGPDAIQTQTPDRPAAAEINPFDLPAGWLSGRRRRPSG